MPQTQAQAYVLAHPQIAKNHATCSVGSIPHAVYGGLVFRVEGLP